MSTNFTNNSCTKLSIIAISTSYLVHFIGQIRALGSFCTDPSWDRHVGLQRALQRKLHWPTAGDTVELDCPAKSSCVREIYFCLGSNEVSGFLHIRYSPLWNGNWKNIQWFWLWQERSTGALNILNHLTRVQSAFFWTNAGHHASTALKYQRILKTKWLWVHWSRLVKVLLIFKSDYIIIP